MTTLIYLQLPYPDPIPGDSVPVPDPHPSSTTHARPVAG